MNIDQLRPCPFCGCDPYLDGDGDNWQDESRYVEMSLECCVKMRVGIVWREARDMSPVAREGRMRDELIKSWNQRFEGE